jgi:ribulose-phosphate 3-epimerase
MKISASILAADKNNLLNDIHDHINEFELLHIDIGDNIFCPTYGISYEVLYEIDKTGEYKIDLHLMIENPLSVLPSIKNLTLKNITVHCESTTTNEFIKLKSENYKLGIGVLISSPLTLLEPYLILADSVLLLCVEPGFSNQNPKISPIKRVRDFQNMFPNYTGKVSVDGGVKDFMLPQLKKLGVNIAVQGGAIFAR